MVVTRQAGRLILKHLLKTCAQPNVHPHPLPTSSSGGKLQVILFAWDVWLVVEEEKRESCIEKMH